MTASLKEVLNYRTMLAHGVVCRCEVALVQGIGGRRLIQKGKANQMTFAGFWGGVCGLLIVPLTVVELEMLFD